ncbi:Hypothetical predicted protein, partial [Mytilus galloprovincialis]
VIFKGFSNFLRTNFGKTISENHIPLKTTRHAVNAVMEKVYVLKDQDSFDASTPTPTSSPEKPDSDLSYVPTPTPTSSREATDYPHTLAQEADSDLCMYLCPHLAQRSPKRLIVCICHTSQRSLTATYRM